MGLPIQVVVTQSNACLSYLGRKLGLMGASDAELIRVEQGMCQVRPRIAIREHDTREGERRERQAGSAASHLFYTCFAPALHRESERRECPIVRRRPASASCPPSRVGAHRQKGSAGPRGLASSNNHLV